MLDRALAAVSGGPVLHAVLETPVAIPGTRHVSEIVDLRTGRARPALRRSELWYDGSRQLLHWVDYTEGARQIDVLESPAGVRANWTGGTGPKAGAPAEPALAAFVTGYRQALADGTARPSGAGVVAGHRVVWLRFPAASRDSFPQEVAVDGTSYRPLALRWIVPRDARCGPSCTYGPQPPTGS